mmetsp:Transcript_30027/g.63696  ORF Transcript_30027/g.63696 Transcript_30027/m.63696 type:complete len:760 (-) Transcript_30027:358-2637(-)
MGAPVGNANAAIASRLSAVSKVYGPTANVYSDVLGVPPDATTSQIREAFFCLRYDIYRKLDAAPDPAGGMSDALTSDERREVEARMDAITAGFQILSDGGRRKAYDASLLTGGPGADGNARRSDVAKELDTSIDSAGTGGGGSVRTPAGRRAGAVRRPFRLSPSKADGGNDRGHLPIGQRRSVFRRRVPRQNNASSAVIKVKKSGMNESRNIVAEPVTGGLNERKALSPVPDDGDADDIFDKEGPTGAAHSRTNTNGSDSIFGLSATKTDSVFTESSAGGAASRKEPNWADFGQESSANTTAGKTFPGQEARDDQIHGSSTPNNDHLHPGWGAQSQDEELSLPAGVSDLNAREQMLYRNQMHLSQQKRQAEAQHHRQQRQQQQNADSSLAKGGRDRLGSRYDDRARGDKYAIADEPPLASPTGVDDLNRDEGSGDKWTRHGARRPSPTTTTDSNMTEEDETTLSYNQATASVTEVTSVTGDASAVAREEVGKGGGQPSGTTRDDDTATRASSLYDDDTRTYDDDTRTYGDDTRTYDDTTSYADETTTLGTETVDDHTVDESTWASEYDDDGTSYASPSQPRDGGYHGGKYSPGHKKGKKPMPILKRGAANVSAANGNVTRTDSEGTAQTGSRRVTIHSHRGRGEEADDFSLFEGASCPIPSLTAIQEEVTGTYKDFTSALHQVSNAFVISPDDIDRMADKIRDAKIELGENYHRQVKERQQIKNGGDDGRGGGGEHKQQDGGGGGKQHRSDPRRKTVQL